MLGSIPWLSTDGCIQALIFCLPCQEDKNVASHLHCCVLVSRPGPDRVDLEPLPGPGFPESFQLYTLDFPT